MSSATFDQSDIARMIGTFTSKNDQGQEMPADPTVVTCQVKTPTNVATIFTFGVDAELTKITLGKFKLEIPVPIVGTWTFRWKGTGAVTAADEEKFVVKQSEFQNP